MTTQTQHAFISDLRAVGNLVIPMGQIQEKYSYIASKAQVKRDIDSLVDSGRVKRTKVTLTTNGRFMSSTIYQLLIEYTPEEMEMMESENYFQNISK